MKKSWIIIVVVGVLNLFLFWVLCGQVWADGHSENGNTSPGGNSSCDCSGVGSPICSTSCGKNGGGKSWRVYKVNKETTSVEALNNYNKKAQWPVVVADWWNGKNIENTLKTCAKQGTPYVMLFGFNKISTSDGKKEFYVMFNQSSAVGCNNNRGCYYEWNNTGAITNYRKVSGASSGQIVKGSNTKDNNAAYDLYTSEEKWANKSLSQFKMVGAFCTWGARFTLTAYARDEEGALLNGKESIDSDEVKAGKTATVDTNGFSASGYTFTGWSESKTGAATSKETSFSKENMSKNEKVYAVYKKDDEGGCVGECCDEDCDGECGSWTPSSYTSSNDRIGTTSTVSKVRNETLFSGWDGTTYAKPTDTVGWIHCYYPGVQKTANTEVTVEASHKPSFDPLSESPRGCGEWTSNCTEPSHNYNLTMKKIKDVEPWENKFAVNKGNFDNNATTFNESYGAGDSGMKEHQNSYTINVEIGTNFVGKTERGALFEESKSGQPSYVSINNPEKHEWNCYWGVIEADVVIRSHEECTKGEDGSETCTTVVDETADRYGWTGKCTHPEQYVSYYVNSSIASDWAKVLVPYNFELSSELDEGNMKKDYYAGEEVKDIKSWSFVNPRQNNVTSGSYGEYATIVRSAKKRLEVCVKNQSGNCDYTYYTIPDSAGNNGVLNRNGLMDGTSDKIDNGSDKNSETVSFNVPDVAAGTEICIRSGLFPKDSGEDKNMNAVWGGYDVNNIEHWAWSEPMCVRVSKRPSIQVLGGNVYSGGKIVTSLGTKKLIVGRYDENDPAMIDISRTSVGTGARTFGSWGELGVISKGGVKGFASGAAVGYAQIQNPKTIMTPDPFVDPSIGNVLGSNPGGSTEKDFCGKLSPLTIAGACSGNEFKNGYGNKGNSNNRLTVDYKSILTMVNEKNGAGGTNDTGIEIVEGQIAGGTYQRNRFGVLSHDGDIKITGDIMIDEGVYFETFSQIPKLVIYTKGNIEIGCDVGRIDAILVAGGTVSTCVVDDFGGLDESNGGEDDDNRYDGKQNHVEYSRRQLQINGAVIAAKLDASRTYGAATGSDSIVPAEMINYDPTLYLWNTAAADTSDGDKNTGLNGELTVTYINELAPRY